MKEFVMKKIIIGMIITGAAGGLIYRAHAPKNAHDYRIAIITPVSHPALERIEQRFKKAFNDLVRHQAFYKTYNAQGKKTLMRAQVDEAVNGDFDVIVTLGAGTTLMTHERIRKAGKTTPQIFAAVAKPERNGIVQNTAITGVVEQYNPTLQVNALVTLKPTTKNVLIVYDPSQTPELANDATQLSTQLQARGCTPRKVEITGVADISNKIPALLDGVDAVIVLIDNTVVSGIDVLIKQCNQRGITLVASDLDSGIKGAALAVGIREESYGQIAAQQAVEIIVNKKQAQTIPFSAIDKQHIQINIKTMLLQNLITQKTLDAYAKESTQKDVVCVHLP